MTDRAIDITEIVDEYVREAVAVVGAGKSQDEVTTAMLVVIAAHLEAVAIIAAPLPARTMLSVMTLFNTRVVAERKHFAAHVAEAEATAEAATALDKAAAK